MDNTIYTKIQSLIKTKKTYHMDAFDFYEITQLIYGKSIQMLDTPDDSTHEYTVTKDSLTEDDNEQLQEAIDCGGMSDWQYGIILNDLCDKGYLNEGDYFLSVS